GLDLVALGARRQAESLEGFELQWLQTSPVVLPGAARAPGKKIMRIDETPAKVIGVAHAALRAVGPGVGAHPPRRPMPRPAVLLIGFDLCIAHACKVIVGGIELAHVLKAQPQVLPLAPTPHGGAVKARAAAAL